MAGPPKVRVLPALIVTEPPGFKILIPAKAILAPSVVVLAVVTVLSHTATFPSPGTAAPTQLLVRLRLSVLSAFVIDVNVASLNSAAITWMFPPAFVLKVGVIVAPEVFTV